MDLVLANAAATPTIHHYNLVNPTPGVWSTLLPTITQYFTKTTTTAQNNPIEPVPFPAWLSALRASAALGTEDVAKNPGIKLLDFYEGMDAGGSDAEAMLETDVTARTSASMRDLTPVGDEWMGIWLKQWGF